VLGKLKDHRQFLKLTVLYASCTSCLSILWFLDPCNDKWSPKWANHCCDLRKLNMVNRTSVNKLGKKVIASTVKRTVNEDSGNPGCPRTSSGRPFLHILKPSVFQICPKKGNPKHTLNMFQGASSMIFMYLIVSYNFRCSNVPTFPSILGTAKKDILRNLEPIISGWWIQPLWKKYESQLGLLFPKYGKSYNSCSKPPTKYKQTITNH
jgi:hypothetical protein